MDLVSLVAVLAVPATIAVLAWRDERAFRALMEGQAASLDRILRHVADAQAAGEPAVIMRQKLAVAEKDIAAKVEIARLKTTAGAFDPLQD